MVGEQFDVPSGEVLGVVLSTKFSGDTISLWHRNAGDAQIVATLKSNLESLLDMQEGMHLEYENFKEALAAPKREPRQFQKRGDFNTERGGGFRGKRGRGRGGFENGSNFERNSKHSQPADDKAFD